MISESGVDNGIGMDMINRTSVRNPLSGPPIGDCLLSAGWKSGKAIKHARGNLAFRSEDDEIHEYFRNSAFPSEAFVREILGARRSLTG